MNYYETDIDYDASIENQSIQVSQNIKLTSDLSFDAKQVEKTLTKQLTTEGKIHG